MGLGSQTNIQCARWERDDIMELSSESVVLETGKEIQKCIEGDLGGGTLEVSVPWLSPSEGLQGTNAGKKTTVQEQNVGLVDEESDGISSETAIQVPSGAINLLSWNCQGLGSPWTVHTLDNLVKTCNPGLVFVTETKRLTKRCDYLRDKWNYFGMGVDAVGKSVAETGKEGWRFTGFYGHLEAAKRKNSWDLLCKLSKQSIRPWLCAGDFNKILTQEEKQGQLTRPTWQMEGFWWCLKC
ncbi:UNVERIFIED_CONTAM: hypothetical protein Sradi_4357000 [Sesamum radiatum]|uniref:Endonuclease/exonuclease/phosphatase domain-containing protein n=1 Tax=Sesamum radiatum TaxID=300843 RepID=A0AAW2NMX1_SESRA